MRSGTGYRVYSRQVETARRQGSRERAPQRHHDESHRHRHRPTHSLDQDPCGDCAPDRAEHARSEHTTDDMFGEFVGSGLEPGLQIGRRVEETAPTQESQRARDCERREFERGALGGLQPASQPSPVQVNTDAQARLAPWSAALWRLPLGLPFWLGGRFRAVLEIPGWKPATLTGHTGDAEEATHPGALAIAVAGAVVAVSLHRSEHGSRPEHE